jgi:hypothetical protein
METQEVILIMHHDVWLKPGEVQPVKHQEFVDGKDAAFMVAELAESQIQMSKPVSTAGLFVYMLERLSY